MRALNPFRNRTTSRRRAASRRSKAAAVRAAQIESLEDRVLLTINFQIPSPPTAGPSFNGSQFVDLSPGQSVFDLDLFEQNVRNNFIGNSTGFAYSINYQGQIGVRHNGYGDARMADDPNEDDPQKDFTEDTRMTIASVAKTITATAILKLIQDQGMSIDDPIAPYLPTNWNPGPGVAPSVIVTPDGLSFDSGITFRDLLTHHSGIRRIDWDASGSDGIGTDWNGDGFDDDGASLSEQTSYSGVQQLIEFGINLNNKPTYSYENANFALMRVMLPYIWDAVDNDLLELLPAQDVVTALLYKNYVQTQVLEPMGILGSDLEPTETNPTRNFPFPDDGSPSIEYGDRSLLAGGEGWYLSADELATFLQHVRYENTVLNQTTRNLMADNFLGFNNPDDWGWSEGMFGTYYNHGGDLNFLNTTIMSFPNTAQVAILLNSDYVTADVPHASAYSGLYQAQLMKYAFENAWPEIAISGTPDADTFELRRNTGDNSSVDIFLNGDRITTRWVETLDKLTLNGVAGNDTFIIDDVPGALELVLNGGAGNDTFRIGDGDLDSTIRGDVIIDGGSGTDSLFLDDTLDTNFDPQVPLPPGLPDIYFLTDDTVGKIGSSTEYDNLEHIELDASDYNSVFNVLSTAAGSTNEIYANNGIDNFNIGDGDFDTNILGDLLIHGGFHSDNVLIDDSADNVGNDTHTFDESTYTKSSTDRVLEFFFVQEITLDASSNDDTVDILSTFDLNVLTINTDGGEDTVNVREVGELTQLRINTGSANDTIALTPTGQNLDTIAGEVHADTGGGFFDEILINDHNDGGHDTYDFWEREFDTDGFGRLFFDNAERVELRANDGDNRINIREIHPDVRLSIFARGGDDEIVAGHDTHDLDTYLRGDLSVDGGDDDDEFRLNDGGDNVGDDTYQFSGNSFTKTLLDDWTHLHVEDVVLNASEWNNTINIGSVIPIDLTINAFLGNDTINIGSGRGDLMRADVHINGSLGNDRININNQDAQGSRTYTFAGQTFDMTGAFFGALSYTSIADIVLYAYDGDAGDWSDTIDVVSSVLSTDIEVFAYGGHDTFNIGTGDLDAVGGDVIAHGGDGADVANIFDQNDVGDDDYTVTNNSVSKSNFLLQYDGLEELNLFANPDENTINVESTLLGTPVNVAAGAGDDTIHLAPTSQSLSNVMGRVTVAGEDGVDEVVLHDENFLLGFLTTYTVDFDQVDRGLFFGGLMFDTIEEMRLEAGAGNDSVNVVAMNPDVWFRLNGHNGADQFHVQVEPSALGTDEGGVTIDGGAGFDAVEITGTAADEEMSVSVGDGTADINLISIEQADADLLGGTDVMEFRGIAGTDEAVEVHASTTPAQATLQVVGELDIVFANIDIIDLLANPSDADTAAFIGTAQEDEFDINLAAEGTNNDPVLQLNDPNSAATLLTLRDYRNFGILEIYGGDGADLFKVYVAPAGPGTGRNLNIDGGAPAGNGDGNGNGNGNGKNKNKGNGKDELTVYRQTPPNPDIDHDHDNQNDSGTFDVDYDGVHQFFIEYSNIEKALSKSGAAD